MEHNETIAYKTWLENLDEAAPEGAWDAIADQLDIDAAWDGIVETLDLDDVWQNIETQFPQSVPVADPSSQLHFPKIFWVAAALILLTLTTPLPDEKPMSQEIYQSQNKPGGKNTVQPELKITEQSNVGIVAPVEQANDGTEHAERKITRNQKPQKSTANKPIHHTESPVNLIQQSATTSADSIEQRKRLALEVPFTTMLVTLIPPQPVDTLSLTEELNLPDSLIVAKADQSKDSTQHDQPERGKWQIGVIGSVKNTWLINPETANGLQSSSLNDTRLTFGKEFGLTLQRSIGGSSAIQFEYYFYSEIGQRYHEYINALYQTKDVRLRYQKFQVVYRTRVWRNSSAPALYAVSGVRVSRLTMADTSIGNESQEVTQEYKPWDYGFILGGEAEFMLTNKILLISGLRALYGLRNIYLGTSQAPAEFNKTHTASVGLVLGLKYRIN